MADIFVGDRGVNDAAAVPPKPTPDTTPVNEPLIVMVWPTPAFTGVKVVITGGPEYVKPVAVTVPIGVVTLTLPEAPLPTTAVIVLESTTVKEAAGILPNVTAVVPLKLSPLIVII